jgi:hypothetical protein
MRVKQLVEWELKGEADLTQENQLQCNSVHHNSHVTWPGIELEPLDEKPTANRLSYGKLSGVGGGLALGWSAVRGFPPMCVQTIRIITLYEVNVTNNNLF